MVKIILLSCDYLSMINFRMLVWLPIDSWSIFWSEWFISEKNFNAIRIVDIILRVRIKLESIIFPEHFFVMRFLSWSFLVTHLFSLGSIFEKHSTRIYFHLLRFLTKIISEFFHRDFIDCSMKVLSEWYIIDLLFD